MNISSFSFTGQPVYHVVPEIYEGLGLPELSSHMEQNFTFTYMLGKKTAMGHGSIRLYKKNDHVKLDIPDGLPGIGPVRMKKLKELLLEYAKIPFMENVNSTSEQKRVYHVDFRHRK
ncbi:hypothetical protein [Bacillus sp. V5-8f]|uniref:hypothetical protein n=1 Tax=Bacillus sp. V5-8f TaxID=2053044 RepID=UPI000C767088|nr:hypothetical protein [Bacillus sp. V5-8f]PLT35150.1 hypothetical protein CUU64_07155 [Bacillus sp. V5-8f]